MFRARTVSKPGRILIVTTESRDIIDQAIAWHMREPAMVEADWLAFAEWLDADPAHARAYDGVVIAMRHADVTGYDVIGYGAMPDTIAPEIAVAPPVAARRWPVLPRRLFIGGGAALAAGLALFMVQAPDTAATADRIIVTGAGAPRNITLADGSLIELNGASRLRIDGRNPRLVALETGEATFHVRHDPAAPFLVRSGDMTVQDVGTVFNVVRSDDRVDVAVAEGEVAFRHGADSASLRPGDAVSARDATTGFARTSMPVEAVGGWRSGRLSFAAEPISRLADAMRRRYGTGIVLSPQLARLPFTGMITLTGDANRDVPHVAALMGARVRKDGERWILSAAPPAQD